MQVSVETTGGLERRLKISVEAGSFEDRVTTKLKETATRVRLKGFRPGKVPLKEVRRRFGPAVREEVAGELMQASFIEAVQQEDLSPAGSPDLEVINIDVGGDLEFTATFEVFPHVEVRDLAEVSVKKPVAEIADDDLGAMIERLREQRKDWHAAARPAEVGDRVTIDFVGRLDGEPFEGGEGKGIAFVIGEQQMIEDLDVGVRGLSAGDESTVGATFPDDYHSDDLKGKTVEFDVVMKTVEAPHIPELDEAFFESFGVTEGGEEAFRENVRRNMTAEMEAAAQSQVKRQVLDELARIHDIALPKALVDREIDSLRSQMMQRLQMPPSADREPLPAQLFEEEARKRVLVGLVINEIVNTEGLAADPDTVRARIEQIAQPYEQPEQIVNWYYSDEAQLQQVEMAVLEDQVIEHVLSKAAVEVAETTYEDIVSGRATAPVDDAASVEEQPDAEAGAIEESVSDSEEDL